MINTFLESLESYRQDLDSLTLEEFQGQGDLNDRTILLLEKIKIADIFSRYIVERCRPSEVNPLRRLVENYEYRVEVYAHNMVEGEEYSDLKNMTAFIDMLFGMDTPYYDSVYSIVNSENLDKVIECVSSADYNYENIVAYIKGGRWRRI